jgi:hypothetical protein
MLSQWHQRLLDDGWLASSERFWEAVPCFYDLGRVKTVILFPVETEASAGEFAEVFYWKHGGHNLPDYLERTKVEIRRYKLHHSMNALLWHDHGDRPLWPA